MVVNVFPLKTCGHSSPLPAGLWEKGSGRGRGAGSNYRALETDWTLRGIEKEEEGFNGRGTQF
jgi:hypothetical protein